MAFLFKQCEREKDDNKNVFFSPFSSSLFWYLRQIHHISPLFHLAKRQWANKLRRGSLSRCRRWFKAPFKAHLMTKTNKTKNLCYPSQGKAFDRRWKIIFNTRLTSTLPCRNFFFWMPHLIRNIKNILLKNLVMEIYSPLWEDSNDFNSVFIVLVTFKLNWLNSQTLVFFFNFDDQCLWLNKRQKLKWVINLAKKFFANDMNLLYLLTSFKLFTSWVDKFCRDWTSKLDFVKLLWNTRKFLPELRKISNSLLKFKCSYCFPPF